ncbi:thioredoxin-2-like [Chelonus insularis]|uniref:thioredoxin-2-like n=1 Tax=Chelonus insularis TaxID=460826 RepID=UPI00158AFB51|nr:thioredoxin-2-like [Chelonus insularis]
MVVQIKTLEEFKEKLAEAGDKLVVVDFYATWCGPCKVISPKFEEFSNEFTDVIFYKVDVDEGETIATEYEIESMPTFIFFKNQKKIDSMIGASIEKLKTLLNKHH